MKKTNSQSAPRNIQMSGNERIINRTAQRRKKNKRKKLIIRSCMCAAFLLIGVIIVLTMFFNINEITVTGDAVYSSDQIIDSSGVNIGDNLIFASKKKINESVTTQLPYVGSVKVKRHLPTGIELQITTTDAVYAMAQNGYFTLLNENGKILEAETEFIAENITLVNFGEILSAEVGKKIELSNDKLLNKLISIQEECENCELKDITSIDLSDIYNIKLTYQGRIILELGETDKENLSKKLALGQAAIEHQNAENDLYRGTINLTVEGKGFWAEETTTTETTTLPETSTEPASEETTTKSAA